MSRPVFVSAEATKQALTWPQMVATLRAAYALPQRPAANPPRTVARGDGVWLRSLSSVLPSGSLMGAKLFGLSRRNRVSYLIALFDQESGEIVALLDANPITAMRTGATSAVAVDLMARPGAMKVGVLGSGVEAHSHVRAIAAVPPVAALNVYSPSPDNRARFAQTFAAELGIPCRAVESEREAVAGADLVIAAARSRGEKPIVEGAWLNDGMLVVSIGSTLPEQREVDVATIARCDLIVADAPHEVSEGTGDFIAAAKENVDFAAKLVSLNELVMGKVAARVQAARLPMFKSVGSAVQDIAVAELAYTEAARLGLATDLPIDISVKR